MGLVQFGARAGLVAVLSLASLSARAESSAPGAAGKMGGATAPKTTAKVAAFPRRAHAKRGRHELLGVSPLVEKGRIVGARITVALYPAGEDQVVLSLLRPSGKADAAPICRGQVIQHVKPGQEHAFEVRYGKGLRASSGEKLFIVSSWGVKGRSSQYRDPFAMVVLPGKSAGVRPAEKSLSPASVASKIYALRKK